MSPDEVPRVLFFTDNGHGLGHLTRMSAVAHEGHGRFQPVFLTMSMGFPLLRDAGLPAEFVPSYAQIGLTKKEWSPLLAMRIAEAVKQSGARVVVVDHVMPPSSFGILKPIVSGVRFVWSRRGLWRAGRNEDYLGRVQDFHAVVEPGDLASPIDAGATVRQRHRVRTIAPVVLVQPEDYLDRRVARDLLGLPAEGRVILVQLTDSNTRRLRSLIEKARTAVTSAADGETVHIFTPLHPLHSGLDLGDIPGVFSSAVYPIARYFRAFDGAISTAGYNSFHELVVSGLPTVFLARDTDRLDDQERRARYAALSGRGYWVSSVDDSRLVDTVRMVLRPEEAEIASATAKELGPMTGAAEFAEILYQQTKVARAEKLDVGNLRPSQRVRDALERKLVSGNTAREGNVEALVVVAADHDVRSLEELAKDMERLQNARRELAPIFLVGPGSTEPVFSRGFLYETLMTPEEWEQVAPKVRYPDYLQERILGLQQRYAAEAVKGTGPKSPDDSNDTEIDQDHNASSEVRSFSLRLPNSTDGAERTLAVEVPSWMYVPKKLEQHGLRGYEIMSLACWLAILSMPGNGAAYDVGANVGVYAWLASALSQRPVVAFEPVDELVEAMGAVARRNRLDIRLERIALSDHEGFSPLYISDRTDSSNSLMPGFRESSRSIDVRLRTLDAFVDESNIAPFVIKIDTETHEPEVLAGATSTLSTFRPWLIVEVLAGRTEERLMEVLSPFDYVWYLVSDALPFEPNKQIQGDPTYRNTNWLLAPSVPEDTFWDELARWKGRLESCEPNV